MNPEPSEHGRVSALILEGPREITDVNMCQWPCPSSAHAQGMPIFSFRRVLGTQRRLSRFQMKKANTKAQKRKSQHLQALRKGAH